MKAQKKPISIDYYSFDRPVEDTADIEVWMNEFNEYFDDHFIVNGDSIKVKTLEGTSYNVTREDVVIRGIKGEYYPCKPDIFKATYELVEELG